MTNVPLSESDFPRFNPLSANPTKWSNTQIIRRQIADQLLECV